MNQSSYFNNIADIGSLYLDYVFNYFENEPIIFTCISEYGKIYLCLCSEIRKEQKWIISPCDIFIIITTTEVVVCTAPRRGKYRLNP